jgi:hypothetical protein
LNIGWTAIKACLSEVRSDVWLDMLNFPLGTTKGVVEDAPYTSHQISCSCMLSSGASWPSSRPLSRNVAVLKVQCPWKIGGHKRGREPSSQTPTDDTPATAGKQATPGSVGNSKDPQL